MNEANGDILTIISGKLNCVIEKKTKTENSYKFVIIYRVTRYIKQN